MQSSWNSCFWPSLNWDDLEAGLIHILVISMSLGRNRYDAEGVIPLPASFDGNDLGVLNTNASVMGDEAHKSISRGKHSQIRVTVLKQVLAVWRSHWLAEIAPAAR